MNAPIEPAIVYGLSNEDYHRKARGVSKSALDKIARSPAHYYAAYLDPAAPPWPDPTPAMRAGTLAHCATLEPAEFDARYVVSPEGIDRRTKAGKEAWEEFQASAAGREIIGAEERAKAFAQAASVLRLPDVAEAMETGHAEVSMFWTDCETGLACKCRPDWIHSCGDAGVILLDLKTTKDASPREFAKSVANYRYHVQAAFYSDGFEAATGRKVLAFIFAAVEGDYPYQAAAYMLDEAAMQAGRAEYRRNLRTLAECRTTNEWPGYSSAIEMLSLPAWALK
jgi:hypothetical protein